MAFSLDNFVGLVSASDRILKIYDSDNIIKYTINAFSINTLKARNNIVILSTKSKNIELDFSTTNEARLALSKLQSQLDVLKEKTPLFVDKEISNFVNAEGSGTTGPQGETGPIGIGETGPQGFTGIQGPIGFQGLKGVIGTPGANSGIWNLEASSGIGPVSAGNFSTDSSTSSQISEISINDESWEEIDYSEWLNAINLQLNNGTDIYFQINHRNTSELIGIWTIDSATSFGSGIILYITNTVSGSSLFENELYVISWISSGAPGPTGPTGPVGQTGATGPIESITINSVGTNYTLSLSDSNRMLDIASSSTTTITVPLNSSVQFETGTQILLVRSGTGAVGVTSSAGVTLNSAQGYLNLNYQYSAATLVKKDTDVWYIFGDLKA